VKKLGMTVEVVRCTMNESARTLERTTAMGERKTKKPVGRTHVSEAKRLRRPKPRLFDWSKYDPAMSLNTRPNSLADELVTYRDRLRELLKDKGKFVLIKGHEVIGIYGSREEALQQAVDRFRDAPVLVKQIVAKEPVLELGGAGL
jgi:hypothetical protein